MLARVVLFRVLGRGRFESGARRVRVLLPQPRGRRQTRVLRVLDAERVAAEWAAYGDCVPWKQSDENGVTCDLPDCSATAHYSRRTTERLHHCCRRHAEVDVLRGLTDLDPTKIGPDACRSAAAYRFWLAAPDGPVTTKDRDLSRKKKCALSGCFRPRWIAAGGRDCKFCSKGHAKEGTRTGQYTSTLWRPEWKGPAHPPSLDPRASASTSRRESVSSQGSTTSSRAPDDVDEGAAAHSSLSPSPREAQLKAQLDAQALALRELQEEVRKGAGRATAASAADSADEDETGPEGPFAPHYWERDAAVQNPHRPLRDRLISEAPHVYRVKDVDNEYVKVLRERKGQAYHEYLTLACTTSYYWDVNTYLDEIADKLTAGGTPEEQADKRGIVAALQNTHRELYGVINRRKYNIELRTRVNYKELESDVEDESILAEIERRCQGFRKGEADMAEVDPHIRRWITILRKKTDRATLTAIAKTAAAKKGAAARRTAPRSGAPGGNSNKAKGKAPAASAP